MESADDWFSHGSAATLSERVRNSVSSHFSGECGVVCAVSGGIDSMVLMHAVASSATDLARVLVATFDHGTGEHAQAAAALVRRQAAQLGLRCTSGVASSPGTREAEWRAARWDFLRQVARAERAVVATAHTRDDHLETVVMRALRGAGARGLSGLLAPSAVRRPLLSFSRAQIEQYAREHGVAWIDDPSNRDRRHLRNRVRLDLLPAMRAVRPSIDDELLAVAEAAGALRQRLAAAVAPLVHEGRAGRVVATAISTNEWSDDARALLWQSVAEVGGIALDWRGTQRLAQFSAHGRSGTRIPLSGGLEAVHRRDVIELRRRPSTVEGSKWIDTARETRFGDWRFRSLPVSSLTEEEPEVDPWSATLPVGGALEVRAWRDGDRMLSSGGPRRVKRFLADRRVHAADREGWPVVVADGEIVWIPGVRRGHAATVRSGRPRVRIVCDRVRG